MLNRLTTNLRSTFSRYLDTLYQASVEHQTPFFTVPSNQIQIIEDPLDFYLMLSNSIAQSSQKIGLSSLYLGTGPLERHLLAKIKARYQVCPDLQTAMVFDHNRSHRQQNGQSPVQILTRFTEQLGGKNVAVSFMKVGAGKGVAGQVLGVHHQKIYLFDDKVIMGGANLSKNYFLNRKDRYICINSPELSDYLFEYLMILSQQPDAKKLGTHYKLWKYAYMPNKYHQSFKQQLNYLKTIDEARIAERNRSVLWQKPQKGMTLSKNQSIADQIGSSLATVVQLNPQAFIEKREQVRSKLFTVGGEDYVGNELQELGDPFTDLPEVTGQDVHLFPFIQWPVLGQNHEYSLFKKILHQASAQDHLIRLSSGYLNIDNELFCEVAKQSKLTPSMQFLCSAPAANSFFGGGGVKNLVPSMYRCFQYNLLKSLGEKALIKEFFNGRWSFHAKGLWIQQAQNSYLTVVGSSNFNARSRTRDTELQLYIYSGCKALNSRLNKEWKNIEKECKPISLNSIEEDKETKVSWFHRLLSKIVSPVL